MRWVVSSRNAPIDGGYRKSRNSWGVRGWYLLGMNHCRGREEGWMARGEIYLPGRNSNDGDGGGVLGDWMIW